MFNFTGSHSFLLSCFYNLNVELYNYSCSTLCSFGHLSVHVSICLLQHLSFFSIIFLSIDHPLIGISVCLSVHLLICQFFCFSIHQFIKSICPSFCPFFFVSLICSSSLTKPWSTFKELELI